MKNEKLTQQDLVNDQASDPVSTRQILIEAVRRNPRDPQAWFLLGQLLGDREQAIYCLKRVLYLQPDHFEAQTALDRWQTNPSLSEEPNKIPSATELHVVPDQIASKPITYQEEKLSQNSPVITPSLSQQQTKQASIASALPVTENKSPKNNSCLRIGYSLVLGVVAAGLFVACLAVFVTAGLFLIQVGSKGRGQIPRQPQPSQPSGMPSQEPMPTIVTKKQAPNQFSLLPIDIPTRLKSLPPITLLSDKAGKRDIWIVQADGSEMKRLTDFLECPSPLFLYARSWDGSKIAYENRCEGNTFVLMGLDGSVQKIPSDLDSHEFSWSPDGTMIAVDGNDLGLIDLTTMRSQVINAYYGGHEDSPPSWSPFSDSFVVERGDIEWTQQEGFVPQQIYLIHVRPEVSKPLLLTHSGGSYSNTKPAWSPDGSRIAFLSNRDHYISGDPLGSSNFELYVMSPDGSDQTRLTENVWADRPIWSPDGSKIAFQGVMQDGLEQNVSIINPDGSGLTVLSDKGLDIISFAWSPDSSMIAALAVDIPSAKKQQGGIYFFGLDGSRYYINTGELLSKDMLLYRYHTNYLSWNGTAP